MTWALNNGSNVKPEKLWVFKIRNRSKGHSLGVQIRFFAFQSAGRNGGGFIAGMGRKREISGVYLFSIPEMGQKSIFHRPDQLYIRDIFLFVQGFAFDHVLYHIAVISGFLMVGVGDDEGKSFAVSHQRKRVQQ
jgi:hypothetical protein